MKGKFLKGSRGPDERRETYFVHEDGGGRRQSDEVRGEEGEIEASGVEELEGGGEQEVGDHLGQHQGQQDGRLVQGAPGDGQQLLPLEYHSATIRSFE